MLFSRGIGNGISGTMGEIKKTLITKWQLIMARFVDISSRTVLWNGHVVLTTGSTGLSGFIIWSWRWRWPQSNVGADRRNPQASCWLLAHRPQAWGREAVQPVVFVDSSARPRRYTAAGDEWTKSKRCSRDYLKRLGVFFASPRSLSKIQSLSLPPPRFRFWPTSRTALQFPATRRFLR